MNQPPLDALPFIERTYPRRRVSSNFNRVRLCFLNLSPRSVLRDPFSSLLSLIASEFFTIPTPSVENRRMQFLSYGEPFLPPSRVRSSPFFHASHLRFDDTYLSSTLQHARSTRYDNRSFRTLFIRSDLASQNNYRSHRINDIPR